TAAAASRLGMGCLLVLGGQRPATSTGNLSLDHLLGADVQWAGDVDEVALEALAADRAAQRRAAGARPYVVPFGGSGPIGAQGYVDCARELEQQAPYAKHVVVAVGSGGTMAGLVASLGAHRV